jgi:glycosyltransferase involved in cell wall biosynthesis
MKLTLAITTYNRTDLTIESFSKVYNHPLIDEIVILDDASDMAKFIALELVLLQHPAASKIKLYRNPSNLGMSRNKAEAISKARNEWVIILDSDNVLGPEYMDYNLGDWFVQGLNPKIIYCPQKAEPDYDFSKYSFIDKNNAKDYLGDKMFRVLLNTCNYVVNRDEYLKVYKYDPTIKESDTIHFNYLWLAAGNSFYIVPGMKYFHRRHEGSGWLSGDHKYNMKKANEIQEKIKML